MMTIRISVNSKELVTRDRIFSCVRPFYEQAVSNLDLEIYA